MNPAPSIGSEKFTDEFLEELRSFRDPDADAAVRGFFDGELEAPATGLMEAMIRHHPGSDEASPALTAFLNEPVELPEWADLDRLHLAQDVFLEYLPQFGLALWMASIPAGYAGAKDVVVLARTHELMSNPKRRFLETGQFVVDVMTHGALKPGAKGLSDIRHVRLMHAAVRHMLTHEADAVDVPKWDHTTGEPINQMALLATMFTFSVVGVESVNKLGVRLKDDEQDAYAHAWSIIGSLMGIRDDLLPLNFADSQTVWNSIKRTQYAACPEGAALTRAAIEVMQRLLPGRLTDGLPEAGIRYLLDGDTAKILGLERPNWTSALFAPLELFGSVLDRFERGFPPGRWASEQLGRLVMQTFIDGEWDEERRPRETKRGGDIAFDAPQQIRRRVGLD
jgi:hypothetical protein